MFVCVFFYFVVECSNAVGCVDDIFIPTKFVGRKDGREYYVNAVSLSKFYHRNDVAEGFVDVERAVVLSAVVCAGVNYYNIGMKVNYVLAEAQEKLRRCLAADTAVDIVVNAEKIGMMVAPEVGDGISEEDNPELFF